MWIPITESRTNKNPNWVQVGTSGIPVCDKHTKHGPVNTPGSWMATKKVVPYKKLYPCCPKGEIISYYLHYRFIASKIAFRECAKFNFYLLKGVGMLS